jgi:hypothetical protein
MRVGVGSLLLLVTSQTAKLIDSRTLYFLPQMAMLVHD